MRFRKRNGKVQAPPNAMRLPAAKGLKWKGESEDSDPVNTGMFASHAPRMKKQVMANQHMVAATPHWGALIRNRSGSGAATSTLTLVTCTSEGFFERSGVVSLPSAGLGGSAAGIGDSSTSTGVGGGLGTSSKSKPATIQKTAQIAAIIQAGLVYPLKIVLENPTLYLKIPCFSLSGEEIMWERDLQESADKGSKAKTNCLSHHEPSCECGATSDTNNAGIGAIAFGIHPKGETQPGDDAANENQVEKVCLVRHGIQYVPKQSGSTGKVERSFIATCSVIR